MKRPPTKTTRPRFSAPRLWVNIGVLLGGLVGFVLQARWNLDNINAFIVTVICACLGVFIMNLIWFAQQRNKGQ